MINSLPLQHIYTHNKHLTYVELVSAHKHACVGAEAGERRQCTASSWRLTSAWDQGQLSVQSFIVIQKHVACGSQNYSSTNLPSNSWSVQ